MRILFTLLLLSYLSSTSIAQPNTSLWTSVPEETIERADDWQQRIIPQQFDTYRLDLAQLKTRLRQAPLEGRNGDGLTLSLPFANGTFARFEVFESPIMEPGLALKYPNIKTYKGYLIENPATTVRMDFTPNGFHAMIQSTSEGTIFIDPYAYGQQTYHMVYHKKDFHPSEEAIAQKVCHVATPTTSLAIDQSNKAAATTLNEWASSRTPSTPIELRTYRLAVATTGEYTIYHGGTVPLALAEMVTAINRVNTIFEAEIAVRMILVANTDLIIFTNPATDPFTNGNTGAMIDENPATVNNAIGFNNYDVGHVFGTNAGGLAQLGSVCGNSKARGVTCLGNPIGDPFYVDYLCHELGHQFDANHTFNNCGGNENSGTAFEPGSGSTIMSYSGLCGSNNVQFAANPNYHSYSLEEMILFTRIGQGDGCATKVMTSNNTPEATILLEDGFYIPIQTPFALTGSATDQDGDNLTYNWDPFNLGPLQQPLGSPAGNSPLFKSVLPSTSPTRIFPKLTSIINNFSDDTEVLPSISRLLNFRFTVRDNNVEGGGVDWDEIAFEATASAGPFLVTAPNTNVDWKVGDYVEVNWDVANTDNSLVNCQTVNIKLSTDGGFTYPIMLMEAVPNDGSHFVVVPNLVGTTCRVMVEAADNIFFDISNTNFKIIPPTEAGFALNVTPYSQQVCLPNSPIIDLDISALLNFDEPVTFEVTGLPAGAVPVFTTNPALPTSTNNTLSFDMSAVTVDGDYQLQIIAYGDNTDTTYREAIFSTIYSDFTSFTLTEPAPGSSGVEVAPVFKWTANGSSDAYDIEIATNPAFGSSIIDAIYDFTGTEFQSNIVLDANTLYYWRARPKNICGEGNYTDIATFHTVSLGCEVYSSNDGPKFISESQLPNVSSTIAVVADGTINDLNILNIDVEHDAVQHVDLFLKGPDGTEVKLLSSVCGNTKNFSLGFDDQAPSVVPCPPIGGLKHVPEESLSAFNDLSTAGDWQFRVKVIDTDGDGGFLNSWKLELCSNVNPSGPTLINNLELPLPPSADRAITFDFLLAEDVDNVAEELVYTLVSLPTNGNLLLNAQVLTVGDQFSQRDINESRLDYFNTNVAATEDHFLFTVVDGDGGWIDITEFDILIDPDVNISTLDLVYANYTSIFPNPADQSINIHFAEAMQEIVQYTILNIQGKELLSGTIAATQQDHLVPVQQLSNGIYFVKFQMGQAYFAKKFSIQR